GHVTDSERVFGYRALVFGRGDENPLPGFDEKAWVPAGRFDARSLIDLAAELDTVRRATIALFSGLDAEALARRGTANNAPISVRALAWISAGHGPAARPGGDGPPRAGHRVPEPELEVHGSGLHRGHDHGRSPGRERPPNEAGVPTGHQSDAADRGDRARRRGVVLHLRA